LKLPEHNSVLVVDNVSKCEYFLNIIQNEVLTYSRAIKLVLPEGILNKCLQLFKKRFKTDECEGLK